MIVPAIIFLLFLLGQFGRISFNAQEINLYLYEVVYFGWIAYLMIQGGKKSLRRALTKPLVMFLVVLAITFIAGLNLVSLGQSGVSFLYVLRLSAYLISFPYTVEFFRTVKKESKRTFLLSGLGALAATGIMQYVLYPNLRNLQYLGWDPHQSRLFGQFLDTSVAGGIYGLILLFILTDRETVKNSAYKWGSIIIFALSGLLTYSRGFMVSILGVLSIYFIQLQKAVKPFLLVILVIFLFAVFSPKLSGEGVNLLRTSTLESRVENYRSGLNLWQRYPLFGIGYNRIRYFKDAGEIEKRGASHAGASYHSSFLIMLVASGLMGLGAYLYFLASLTTYGVFATLAVIFLSIYSLFDNILLHPFIMYMLPVLTGLSLTSRKKP